MMSETLRGSADIRRINKINAWRLVPILLIGYVLNTLNKTNVGFASLEMSKDLGFTPTVFGLGAGLFFITYALFEVPSNVLLRRYGARIWLPRILISWGIISAAMALTFNETSFYVLRLALGVAEAGWYAGVMYYLTLWFPRQYRARATMFVFLGAPLSAIIGNPVSGLLISMHAVLGIAGWQWLFIIEGLPTLVLGLLAYWFLRNGPADAEWLESTERDQLIEILEQEQATPEPATTATAHRPVNSNLRLLYLSLVNLFFGIGLYGAAIWAPTLVKNMVTLTNVQVGCLTAIPYAISVAGAIWVAQRSDRSEERRWYVAGASAVSAVGAIAMAISNGPLLGIVFLTVSVTGTISGYAVFFAMAIEHLRSSPGRWSLAARLGIVTTAGNIGGFVGPYALGVVLATTGRFKVGLLGLGVVFLLGTVLVVAARQPGDKRPQSGRPALELQN
jgi:MFS transporter, ACS family, tartrate transporter